MMNNARLVWELRFISIRRACQQALTFAKDRIQGKKFGEVYQQILDHADVRRTLLERGNDRCQPGYAWIAVLISICQDYWDRMNFKKGGCIDSVQAFSTDIQIKLLNKEYKYMEGWAS